MKKSIPVVATLAAIVVGTAATSTALASSASTATAGRNSKLSGALVIAWNQELLKIVQTPGAQPATVHQTRSYAMLHAAIDDAIVSITGDASPLLVSVRAPRGARPDAAAIEAGRATLTALYPGFKGELAQLADGELATISNGADKQHVIQVGDDTAARILQLRANDGSAVIPPPFTPGTQPGNYRPTPPNFPTPVFTTWGKVTPFVLKNGSQFRPGAPPALTGAAYAQALNEVKSLGQNSSTTRTADQTVIGKFWAPPIWNTWNVIAENAALAHHTNLERTARLFAILNLSSSPFTVGKQKLRERMKAFGRLYTFLSQVVPGHQRSLRPYGYDYFTFVLIGSAASTFFSVGLSSFAGTLSREQATGTLEALLVTPHDARLLLASGAIWSFALAALQTAVYLAAGTLFLHAHIATAGLGLVAAMTLLALASFSGLGLLAAATLIQTKRGGTLIGFAASAFVSRSG